MDSNGYTLDYVCRDDAPLLRLWRRDLYSGRVMPAVDEAEHYIAESTFANSFILRYLDFPLMRLDVCDAFQMMEFDEYYEAIAGDFSLNLVIPPLKHPAWPLLQEGLSLCLGWFFSFEEVKQLVSPFIQEEIVCRKLVFQAGFNHMRRPSVLPESTHRRHWAQLSKAAFIQNKHLSGSVFNPSVV
ncbi:MAG TPA: hypothetical protein VLD19_06840 [Chitinophagaceae bacterium]|nr:hypothetical protein [Chitinophagaceae bacterium]